MQTLQIQVSSLSAKRKKKREREVEEKGRSRASFFSSGNAAFQGVANWSRYGAVEKQIWLPRSNPCPSYRDVLPLDSASTPSHERISSPTQERMNKGQGPAGENDIVVVDVARRGEGTRSPLCAAHNRIMRWWIAHRIYETSVWAPESFAPIFACYVLLSYYVNGRTFRARYERTRIKSSFARWRTLELFSRGTFLTAAALRSLGYFERSSAWLLGRGLTTLLRSGAEDANAPGTQPTGEERSSL